MEGTFEFPLLSRERQQASLDVSDKRMSSSGFPLSFHLRKKGCGLTTQIGFGIGKGGGTLRMAAHTSVFFLGESSTWGGSQVLTLHKKVNLEERGGAGAKPTDGKKGGNPRLMMVFRAKKGVLGGRGELKGVSLGQDGVSPWGEEPRGPLIGDQKHVVDFLNSGYVKGVIESEELCLKALIVKPPTQTIPIQIQKT
ncbi:hypothetical protein JTB14_002325 [Gonioctena quinquepunctata]|nr:hypothetical protein JTB14_002325 [Gonioctena quinquepunctata]